MIPYYFVVIGGFAVAVLKTGHADGPIGHALLVVAILAASLGCCCYTVGTAMDLESTSQLVERPTRASYQRYLKKRQRHAAAATIGFGLLTIFFAYMAGAL